MRLPFRVSSIRSGMENMPLRRSLRFQATGNLQRCRAGRHCENIFLSILACRAGALFCEGWCAKIFQTGWSRRSEKQTERRRLQKRRGSSSWKNRGGDRRAKTAATMQLKSWPHQVLMACSRSLAARCFTPGVPSPPMRRRLVWLTRPPSPRPFH